MKKRGQATVFAISGAIVILIFGLFFYLRSQDVVSQLDEVKKEVQILNHDLQFLRRYSESCLKEVSQKAIWLSGYQGGYIDPELNDIYGDYDVVDYIYSDGYKVPYYIQGGATLNPTLDQIKEKISRYIIVEFKNCFDVNMLKEKGFDVTLLQPDFQDVMFDLTALDLVSDVSINEEDITVYVEYPVKVSKGNAKITIRNFFVNIPVRLKTIYGMADLLLLNIINDDFVDGHFCIEKLNNYALDADVNVILDGNIIKFIDASTYNSYKSYFYQFAVDGINFMDCS